MDAGYFATLNGYDQFGLGPARPVAPPAQESSPAIATVSGPSLHQARAGRMWSPESPMFWFALLLATTVGLVAFSTELRVGKARGRVGLGTT